MNIYITLAVCLMGVVYSQLHGHALHEMVDAGFRHHDVNNDGIIEETEFDNLVLQIDANNDSCVTLQEYAAASHHGSPPEVTAAMFHHFDHNHDDCLEISDMHDEFHLYDKNGDNQVNMHEFEQYYSHLLNSIAGHGSGK